MVQLGDEVKCKITGFRGIAVSRHTYMQGCERISIQPKTTKDGKLPDSQAFDEPQLIVLKSKRVAKGRKNIGGPEKWPDTPRR